MKEYTITLSLKTNSLIVLEVGTQMGGSGNSVGEEIGLNGKKTMVEDFMSIISQVSLQPNKEDSRTWNDPPSYTFSVKSAYNKLGNHGSGGYQCLVLFGI